MSNIRELPRIFSYVEKYGIPKDIPKQFKLNKGHIKFFSIRLKYLFERYCLLLEESKRRGYNINYTIGELYYKYNHLIVEKDQINYTPTMEDIKISHERLIQKTLKMFFRGDL